MKNAIPQIKLDENMKDSPFLYPFFKSFIGVIWIFIVLNGCAYYTTPTFISRADKSEWSFNDYHLNDQSCADKMNYLPDTLNPDFMPIRHLRVNFHVMNNKAGTVNFPEKEGREYIKRVMWAANERLKNNNKLFLPPSNNLPVLPLRYRLVLTPNSTDPADDGIYFHYDDDCYFMVNKGKKRNLFDNRAFERYGVAKDTVLNIFLMAHHPDSLQSPTYQITGNGIARFSWLKLMTWYNAPNKDPWESIKLLHHEIGHCLGLLHAWTRNDGCDDTPSHPNCWHCSMPSPCDSICSNNIMDYNAYMGAWSPCQIATIHYNLSTSGKLARKLVRPDWCTLDETTTITISDTVVWSGSKDLSSHIVVKSGGLLHLKCRLSLPAEGIIFVEDNGVLLIDENAMIHNDCGDTWKGIKVWRNKKRGGRVLIHEKSIIQDVEFPIAASTEP